METFVENCSELSQRSFASYLIFAAGEVKGRTASGPGLSCRERSRLKDLLPISIQRHLAQDTQLVGTLGIVAREAKPARRSHQRKPPKPKGLALFQGRWRPITMGVKEVRARERGPEHLDGIRRRRDRRRRGRHLVGVSSRQETCDARE